MNINDPVNHPSHYTSGAIECIVYMEDVLSPEEFRGYLRGQIIKYQHRLMSKSNPGEDAGKLAWYSAKLHNLLNNNKTTVCINSQITDAVTQSGAPSGQGDLFAAPKKIGRPKGSKNRPKKS